MSDPRSDAPTPEAVRELVERLRTLAKGLRFAAGRGKVSADNANYSCGVSIREAELSAQAMEDAAGLLRPTTDVAVEHEDTPPQPTRVLDLLVRLTGEGKRAAALRILERHMVSKIDDGTRVVQSARSDAPTPEAVRERLQRDATWAYTALSAIAADCEGDAAGLLRPTTAETCTWTIDDVGGESAWVTACKREFHFDDDGSPVSNGLRWCASCGRPLVEATT